MRPFFVMNTKKIAYGGMLAALYAVITLATSSFSYGTVQFRIAEALCVLCWFTPSSVWGLTLGCLAANLFSPVSGLDVLVGTAATLLACLAASQVRKPALVPLPVILINALLVGAELSWVYMPGTMFFSGLALYGAQVALGEAAVLYVIGLPMLLFLRRQPVADRLRAL